MLVSIPILLGTVATAYASNSFAVTLANGTLPVKVDVSTTMGSATLAYQVERSNGVVTISSIDITPADGLAAITAGLIAGAPVKVYGVPQADATLKAYVLAYYTGTMRASRG